MELSPIQQMFYQQLLPIIATFLSTVLTILLGYAAKYLMDKVEHNSLKHAISIAEGTMYKVVSAINQTIVHDLKAAASDGKLTDDEKTHVKNLALGRFYNEVNPRVLEILKLGFDSVDGYVENMLESFVLQLK